MVRYLTDRLEPRINGSIDPALFDHIALQILAAEIVQDQESLVSLLLESLSAFVAGDTSAMKGDGVGAVRF